MLNSTWSALTVPENFTIMGTYIYARLKDKSESAIDAANKSILRKGYPTETHNNVLYGFFTSRAQLEEDARFMNEDPEGLKQAPHWKRPITVDDLSSLFWNEIGCGVIKISGCDDQRQRIVDIVRSWLRTKTAKQILDLENSDNIFKSQYNQDDKAPKKKNFRVKTFRYNDKLLENYPNFHRTGSIRGMKKLYYGQDALLVRKGNYIYNVTSNPQIYHEMSY